MPTRSTIPTLASIAALIGIGFVAAQLIKPASSPSCAPGPSAALVSAPPGNAPASTKAALLTALSAPLEQAHTQGPSRACAPTLLQARLEIDALLQYGAPATVMELAYTPMSERGRALALWAKASFEAGREDMLAAVFVQLVLGENRASSATEYLEFSLPRPDAPQTDARIYPHAKALGYYSGAIRAGFEAAYPQAIGPDKHTYQGEPAEQIRRFLRSAVKYADFFGNGLDREESGHTNARPGTQWVSSHLRPLLQEREFKADVWSRAALGRYSGPAELHFSQGALSSRFALRDGDWPQF